MAESTETGAAAAAGTGTQGAAPGATAEPTGTQPSPGDYEARLRGSHEFAAKMAKEHQARADRLETETRNLRSFQEMVGDDLAQIIKTAGGTEVARAVREYIILANEPKVASAIQVYRQTGQLPPLDPKPANGSAGSADSDEYLTPEERKIQSLERQLAEISQRIAAQEHGTGRSAIEGHFERVAKELPFSEAELGKMRQRMSQITGQLDPKAMRNLATPESFQTVRGMLIGALSDAELETVFERKRQSRNRSLGRLETDRPFEATSQGEPPPSFANGYEAWQWAHQNPDKHESY